MSGRIILSSAQLALAREYGFGSWAKLKLELERRDILITPWAVPAVHPCPVTAGLLVADGYQFQRPSRTAADETRSVRTRKVSLNADDQAKAMRRSWRGRCVR